MEVNQGYNYDTEKSINVNSAVQSKTMSEAVNSKPKLAIMRNFIEYYKKLSMIMKNSYYTYESAKDMIMNIDDFVKLNQTNKRTLYLNEAFEDMGKNNKHDFINQIKLFIQTFNDYKNKGEFKGNSFKEFSHLSLL